ncbi:unnamed protein product [Auanema sp. JU1783]|nr:unnamed protein product [Auanema sp. JU1783]
MAFKILLLLCCLIVVYSSPVKKRDDTDPKVWFCQNSFLRATVEQALANDGIRNNVDELQQYLEEILSPYFQEHVGKWLISVSNFHRVNGYAGDTVSILPTFCAINDASLNMHIIIVKIE